jgi:hypothetical protein
MFVGHNLKYDFTLLRRNSIEPPSVGDLAGRWLRLVSVAFIYLWLRVVHVTRLYQLIIENDVFTVRWRYCSEKESRRMGFGTLISTDGGRFRCEKLRRK